MLVLFLVGRDLYEKFVFLDLRRELDLLGLVVSLEVDLDRLRPFVLDVDPPARLRLSVRESHGVSIDSDTNPATVGVVGLRVAR